MTFGLLLILAAPAPPPDSAAVRESLVEAAIPIKAMAACALAQPRSKDRHLDKFGTWAVAVDEAESLFGPRPAVLRPDVPPPSGCGDRAFAEYEAAAEAGLRKAEQALADSAARMAGLWAGTLRLCGDDVTDAVVEPLFEDGGMSQLTLTLSPALRTRLKALTEDRVGLRMSVRIDGEEVMAPNVNEPLTAGALTVSAPQREDLERIRAAALRACR